MNGSEGTVVIFSAVDFEQVQRHTEKYYLTRYCAERFDTHVVTPSSRLPGVSNHHFRREGILGILLLNLLFLPHWVGLFRAEEPDVVYCYPEVVTPPLLARLVTDAEVVFDVRAEPFEQRAEFVSEKSERLPRWKRALYVVDRRLFGWSLRRADLVVTLSEDLAEKLAANYGIDRGSVHILPLGVSTELFSPSEDSRDAGLSVVYVGTINELRGLDTFLEAVESLDPDQRSRVRLDLVGGGDEAYIDELCDSVARSVPEMDFEYHGYVDHHEVPAVAGQSDLAISLLPDLESYSVSSPAKVYEYLALGLPVVATDIPAHRRILTDGEDAVLVSDDPEAVAAALLALSGDTERLQAMSERARETATRHSWDHRFDELFERIEH